MQVRARPEREVRQRPFFPAASKPHKRRGVVSQLQASPTTARRVRFRRPFLRTLLSFAALGKAEAKQAEASQDAGRKTHFSWREKSSSTLSSSQSSSHCCASSVLSSFWFHSARGC